MKLPRRRFLHLAAGAAALPVVSRIASAQSYPSRPITMVVPFAAGGEADVIGRIVAQPLSEILGKPVIVENVGGAGGATGASRVAKAVPDGYQFLLIGRGPFVGGQSRVTDFATVGLVAESPILLVGRKDLPASNLQEFIAYAKVNQAKMQYGSAGAGSSPHLACVLLNSAIGANVTHIPYRGGGPAMRDLIAGRIDYQCTSAASAVPQIESKTIRAIATLTTKRSSSVPTLASAHEQGLTNFDAGTWYAILLPKGTPAAIVQKLHDATTAAIESSFVQERLKEISADVVAPERRSPEYLKKFVEGETDKWVAIIKAAGVSAQ